MRHIIALLAALVVTPAAAQTVVAPTYQGQDGQAREAIGTFPIGAATVTTVQGANAIAAKSSRGTVLSLNIANGTTAGYVIVYDAAATPTAGASLTAGLVRYCMPLAAGGGLRDQFQTALAMSSGVQVLFSTACSTYTLAATAPIHIAVQFR